MKLKLGEQLWANLIECLENENNFISCQSYYYLLSKWFKEKRRYFHRGPGKDMIERNSLNILTDLEPNDYIEDGEIINLENEIKRFKMINPKRISGVAMLLSSILWDMVTLDYDKPCPNCYTGDIRVIKIRYRESKMEIPILCCETCTWQKGIDQEIPESKDYDYLPLTKEEVEKYKNSNSKRCD